MHLIFTMKFIIMLYIVTLKIQLMKSKQLLSIVFALIMFTGVTMGNAVYAQSEDVGISDSVEVTVTSADDTTEEEHDDEREEDDNNDDRDDERDENEDPALEALDEINKTIEEIEKASDKIIQAQNDGKDTILAEQKLDKAKELLANAQSAFEDENFELAEDLAEDAREFASESRMKYLGKSVEDFDEREHHDYDIDDLLDRFCHATEEDKNKFFENYPRLVQFQDRLENYCDLSEDEQEVIEDLLEKNSEIRAHMDEYKKEHRMAVDEMKEKHKEIADHKKEYERYCKMTESELAESIDDLEKLEKISGWCDMTPEERDDYKKKHHDAAMDFKEKHHKALEKMKEKMEKSPRLKSLIMEKHDDEDREHEIKMKFESKHGDAEKRKSEVKIKFKNHMAEMKIKMSEERKSAILDRVAEMKEFKMEMRENTSNLTDEEKQELRAEFVEKAKEIQLAWISPRTQITAGIDSTEVECREGFSLVLKESNGVPMCLKADTALVMIERGIAVPA